MALSNRRVAALLFADAGGGRCQCRLCGRRYARGNGYSNLLAHLRGAHTDYEARALEAAAGDASAVNTAAELGGEEEEAKASEEQAQEDANGGGGGGGGGAAEAEIGSESDHKEAAVLGKRRRGPVERAESSPTTAEDAAALSPPEKQRKLAQLPASMHEVYALHSARKMELAHRKLRAELALQERRLSLEAAKERNRNVLELVKLGKTPEEIQKLLPLFS